MQSAARKIPQGLQQLNSTGGTSTSSEIEVTAISEQEYKKLHQPPLGPPQISLYGPSQQPLQTAEQFTGSFRHMSHTVTQWVFMVCGVKANLLGLPAITAL